MFDFNPGPRPPLAPWAFSVTGVKGVTGDAAVELHLFFGPGDDVAPEAAAAGRQAVDVAGCQHVRPHVEVRHLAHERLRGVEAAPESVLGGDGARLGHFGLQS